MEVVVTLVRNVENLECHMDDSLNRPVTGGMMINYSPVMWESILEWRLEK